MSLAAAGSAYTQNFDALSNVAGSSNNTLTLTGWFLTESGGGARDNEQYGVDTGGSNTGDTYSYGTAGATDRAIGSLRSGTLIPIFGACFTNNTGSPITSLDIGYTGEEWRAGTAARTDQIQFEYSTNAADLLTGTWTGVAALDFATPNTSSTGAKDGNAAGNRTALNATISSLNIANNATFWIRWKDPDASGADDGLAVDDFSLTPQASGGSPPGLSIDDVAASEGNSGTTTFTFTVSLSQPAPAGGVSFDIATADGTATAASGDYVAKSLTGQIIPASSSSYSFSVTVNGDTTVEPNETFFVNVTNIVGAVAGDVQGQGTIANDDVTLVTIAEIQGTGNSSPLAGASVTTQGIVTGVKSNGFFLQMPDSVPTPAGAAGASRGVFAFTSAAPPAAAAVGNLVQVSATVQEFVPTGGSADPNSPPVTELVAPIVAVVSAGNTLPAPVALTAADFTNTVNNLEKYEGMRVSVASLTAVSGTGGRKNEANATSTSDGTFYGVLTGTARPFREPGIDASDPLPPGSPCCLPRFDTNPERLRVDSDALGGAAIGVSTGAVLTGVVGTLDYQFRTYMIDIDPPSVSPAPAVAPGPPPRPATAPLAGEVTVASFNMERFFDTVNDPGISDVALTAAAFDMRLKKASLAIRDFLRMPDIVGVEEMENLATLQAVAAQISSDAIAAGQPDPQYQTCLIEGNDIGGIDVGFLYKGAAATATGHHVAGSCTQFNKGSLFANPDSSTELLNDRPPLQLIAAVTNSAGDSFPVTVYVNHLRSLNGQDDAAPGPNGWATVGDRVRAKRQAQAVELAGLIQSRQAGFPADHIVVLGDFNAFDVNDGYGDSMGTIAGTPAPDNETAVGGDGVSPVSPPLTNLSGTPAPAERYSYTFGGNAQSIDHILINSTLSGRAPRLEHARIDADFPESLRGDATTPARISDHDPALLYLSAFALSKVSVTETAAPNPVAAGAQIAYTITVTNGGLGSGGNVSLGDVLPANTTFVSLAAPGGWSCTTPAAGTGGTVTCSLASLAPGTSAAFALIVAVAPAVADGTSISNTATVTVAANDDGSGALAATASVLVRTPVDGACGVDNGRTLGSAPTNLCAAGIATAVVGSGPWTWSCQGSSGGATAACSANATTGSVAVFGGVNPIANGDNSPGADKGTDFGNVTVGAQASRSFTIHNPGGAPPGGVARPAPSDAVAGARAALPNAAGDLVIGSITSSNPAFTVSGGTGTIPQGGSAVFTVAFSATSAGPQNATIRIDSNAAATPSFTFAVTANAVAAPPPAAATPAPALDARTLLLLIVALAAIGRVALRRREASR